MFPLPPENAPVPDRRKNVVRSLLLGMLIGTVFGLALVLFAMTIGRSLVEPTIDAMPRNSWLLGSVVIIAWFVSTTVHELGHVVGGLSQGFRFLLFVVGPLRIDRDVSADRLRVSLNTNFEFMGGVAGCMPTGSERLVERLRWLVVGGPLASLLLAAVCFAITWWRPLEVWSAGVLFTGALSVLTGLGTMLPIRNGSFSNDGKRFLELSRDTPEARRDAAIVLHTVRYAAGIPIGSLSRDEIANMLLPADGSVVEMVGRTIAYTWLLEQHDMTSARAQLARAYVLSAGLPAQFSGGVALEMAFAHAWFDRDAAAARAIVAPHQKIWPLLPESERLRFDAALAVADGRTDDARSRIAELRALAERQRPKLTGGMQWALARLDEVERTLS